MHWRIEPMHMGIYKIIKYILTIIDNIEYTIYIKLF